MGWFKKKSDPISERARSLNDQIAQLEAQIKQLSEQQSTGAERSEPKAGRSVDDEPAATSGGAVQPVPKLRSTALPHGHQSKAAGKTGEAGLEDLRNPFKPGAPRGGPAPRELGVESDFSGIWKRFKRHFRAPATSNPKLVSYLAAGSIQGLRPLRYEKRVARNRTILLLVCLILILWGILAIVVR